MPDTDILSYKQAEGKRAGAVQCVLYVCYRSSMSVQSLTAQGVVRVLSQAEMSHRVSEGLGGTGVFQMPLLGPEGCSLGSC